MSWSVGTSNSYMIAYQQPCLRSIEVGSGHFGGEVQIHAIVLARQQKIAEYSFFFSSC